MNDLSSTLIVRIGVVIRVIVVIVIGVASTHVAPDFSQTKSPSTSTLRRSIGGRWRIISTKDGHSRGWSRCTSSWWSGGWGRGWSEYWDFRDPITRRSGGSIGGSEPVHTCLQSWGCSSDCRFGIAGSGPGSRLSIESILFKLTTDLGDSLCLLHQGFDSRYRARRDISSLRGSISESSSSLYILSLTMLKSGLHQCHFDALSQGSGIAMSLDVQ
jgi:hypothetical protein